MSLGVVPHAVEPKKHSVPTVETMATVPGDECLSLVKADRRIVAIATIRSDLAEHANLLLKTYMGQEYMACVCHWKKDYTI